MDRLSEVPWPVGIGYRLLFLILLVGAAGCRERGEPLYQRTLGEARVAIRRGDLNHARALADQGVALTGSQPGSTWAWEFVLLRAEVLLRVRELPEARRLLNAELPSGTAFDLLRARQQYLRGFDQLTDDHRQAASETMARARASLPSSAAADDLRFDIEGVDATIDQLLNRREQGQARLAALLQAAAAKGDRYHQAAALQNLGYGELVQKHYDAALKWLEQVLGFTDLRGFTVYTDALNNAGICYARLGLFDRAIAAQQQVVERRRGGAPRLYEQALGQLGTTHLDAGRDREGVEYLRQALDVASVAGLAAEAGLWAGNLAAAQIKAGNLDEAERFNDLAKRFKSSAGPGGLTYNTLRAADIAARRGQRADAARLFEEALAASPDDPSVRWSSHEGLAQIALADKRPADAMRHFATALDTVEKTRSDLMRTDYKLSYLTRLIGFYRAYVDALLDQGQVERALEVADSSRGRVLAERQGIASPSGLKTVSLRKLAAESGTVFLSYWLAPTRSYLWVVTPSRVQVLPLPPAAEIESLVRQHRNAIENVLADPLAKTGTPGDRLFELLVQPALPSIPSGARIMIAPDAALYALNFETLPVGSRQSAGGSQQSTGGSQQSTVGSQQSTVRSHYLIEDFEIAVAPSLAMLRTATSTEGAPMRSLLLIGNATARAPDYPALKFAGAEMTSVARHFPADSVTSFDGARAMPAAYRTAEPDRFSHVHFTAHATTNLDSPLDSAVILSGPDSSFKLYARDVAELPLRAELVTVSACRSAGERTYSGEGLVGFAWAFLRGGARRVVAGLWDVDDRSTAELMDTLYAGLADGEPVGKSLRTAKLEMLRRGGPTAKPYYWAPFELFTLTP